MVIKLSEVEQKLRLGTRWVLSVIMSLLLAHCIFPLENKEGHCSYLAEWKIYIAFLTMEDICWTVFRCVR